VARSRGGGDAKTGTDRQSNRDAGPTTDNATDGRAEAGTDRDERSQPL
jgi:hypothetical protein